MPDEKREPAPPENENLRDRIAAAIAAHEPVTDYEGADGECIECDLNPRWPDAPNLPPSDGWKRHAEHLADAVIRELGAIPDREFTDQWGHHWEWCGGQPGTWAWRITRLPDQCAECLRRGDERDGCNCAYPEGHPSNDR